MTSRILAAAAAAIILTGCGGGGGGSGGNVRDPGPASDPIRSLTGAAPPAETVAVQSARAPAILSRADSLIGSSWYGETSARELPTFVAHSSCSGTSCTFTESITGVSDTVELSDLEFTHGDDRPIGTKHGVTLIKSTGRDQGVDFRSLGAWMEHGGFSVNTNRFTVDGLRVTLRYGVAGGDLTGSRPTGTATWRGLMVGTPATGADRGDRLQGDAALTYTLEAQTLGAAFTNIKNIDRLRAHPTSSVLFTGVPVAADGTFRAGATGNRIQGGFYGPGHAETAGIFEQSNIVGAFGAKRQ